MTVSVRGIGVGLILASLALSPRTDSAEPKPTDASSASTADAQGATSFFGVRVLKAPRAGELKWSVEFPASCAGCRLQENTATSGESNEDLFFHFFAPSSLKVVQGVHVRVDPHKVRGVIVGRTDATWDKPAGTARGPGFVPYRNTADGIEFDVPHDSSGAAVPAYDAGDVTEEYTYIETPGVQLRIEHADVVRRRGPYASGPWPAVQRAAALNLQFATREAMTVVGLNRVFQERGIGVVTLMGFDTNYPTLGPNEAHGDDPPHWHMHIHWGEEPRVREIGHFYIGTDGLLERNSVGNMVTHKGLRLSRGQTEETRTADGTLLYTQTITPEGHFLLGTPSGSCRFSPVAAGFQSGVDLACDNGTPQKRIRAEDDLRRSRVRVYLNEILVEEHFYDPDTGALKRSEITYGGR